MEAGFRPHVSAKVETCFARHVSQIMVAFSHFTFCSSLFLLFTLCSSLFTVSAQVKTGADLLFSKSSHLIEGKRVGLVTNHTGLLLDGTHLADALHRNRTTRLVALFGPEHGIRGDVDGELRDTVDEATGVPVYSLYGRAYKPSPAMLRDIDLLLFDIQDIGARFYTYVSTLSYSMEAAAEAGIPFVVLDRPNPVRGTAVDGFVLEDSLGSFVGLHRIPIVHGMTVGELALLFNNEGWLANGVKARLTVVPMEGWKRTMWYDETGLPWIAPSPNMKSLSTAIVYPGMCLVEGTNVSEGRGTSSPFETIGAPFVNGELFARELNGAHLPGVAFEPIRFTPTADRRTAPRPKHSGVVCSGVFVRVVDRESYDPIRAGIFVLSTLRRLYPGDFKWSVPRIDRLAGTRKLREKIDAGVSPEAIMRDADNEIDRFSLLRRKYLLY